MTIGNAIFSSTVIILSALTIWKISKHKKWGTVLKSVLAIVAFILITCLIIWQIIIYIDKPRPLSGLGKVELGMSPNEVKIILGEPSSEVADFVFNRNQVFVQLYKDNHGKLIYMIDYKNENNKKDTVSRVCSEVNANIYNFSKVSSISDIKTKLGEPKYIEYYGDGTLAQFFYPKLNLKLIITENRIQMVCVIHYKYSIPV